MNSIRALYLETSSCSARSSSRADLVRRRGARGGDGDGDAAAAEVAVDALAAAQEARLLEDAVVKVLSPREAAIFAAFADAVADAGAAAAAGLRHRRRRGFDAWLAAAPRENRAAIRASLLGARHRACAAATAPSARALRALAAHPRGPAHGGAARRGRRVVLRR